MQKLITLILLSFTLTACQSNPTLSKNKKISVLIVDGFSNHNWKKTSHIVKTILENSNKFTVTISTSPPTLNSPNWKNWKPNFSKHDVVIQNCNNIFKKITWPNHVRKSLESYVKNGGGLYILHSANNAFPDWLEYNKMIGLGWRNKSYGPAITIDKNQNTIFIPKNQGQSTGHGPRTNPLITTIGSHPIHKNLPKQFIAADLEIYTYARGPAQNLTVLSYAKDPKLKINFPIEWTVKYGKGNVYASSFGHLWPKQKLPPSIKCVAFQTLLVRATEWLATNNTTSPTPKNFPTKEKYQLQNPLPTPTKFGP